MARKYQDFRNLQDYVLALRILRKFAPARFTAARGYDLRKWRDVSDIGKKEGAAIRKYYRHLRPLLVYGYKARKIKNRKKLAAQYTALYSTTLLPGIQRIPLPIDNHGNVQPVHFEPAERVIDEAAPGEYVATVTVAPGIVMRRLTWEQMGFDFSGVHGANLLPTLDQIWDRFKPDYAGIVAGISRVKRSGIIQNFNSPKILHAYLQRLQTKYDGGNHDYMNWLHGLELYYFVPPEDTSLPMRDRVVTRDANRKKMRAWIHEEEKRYAERKKLVTAIKNLTRRIAALDKQFENFLHVSRKTFLKTERDKMERQARANYDKRRIDLVTKRDKLTVQLHLTKGF